MVDSREQHPWVFRKSARVLGVETATLKTGDYTLRGFETRLAIERKGSAGELAQNLFQPRFERELQRLDSFEYPFLFLEFDYAQLTEFPTGSGVPPSRWRRLRVRPDMLLRRYYEMRLAHPTLKVEFVGRYGKEAALSLFKRVADRG